VVTALPRDVELILRKGDCVYALAEDAWARRHGIDDRPERAERFRNHQHRHQPGGGQHPGAEQQQQQQEQQQQTEVRRRPEGMAEGSFVFDAAVAGSVAATLTARAAASCAAPPPSPAVPLPAAPKVRPPDSPRGLYHGASFTTAMAAGDFAAAAAAKPTPPPPSSSSSSSSAAVAEASKPVALKDLMEDLAEVAEDVTDDDGGLFVELTSAAGDVAGAHPASTL